MKGFARARLACGCGVAFRDGVEGSRFTVFIETKAPGCTMPLHVQDLPIFDYREALRASTRLSWMHHEDFEEEN